MATFTRSSSLTSHRLFIAKMSEVEAGRRQWNVRKILSALTVEPVAFLFILNIYCEYALVQDMISTRLCMTVTNTGNILCDKNKLDEATKDVLSKEQASQMKYYMGIFSACAILASLFTGSWSDSIGRKPLMILPSLLGIPAEILFATCSLLLHKEWCLILVYLAAFFNGISGGTSTIFSSCFGYMSDITKSENRTQRLTLLEASIFIGGFLGYNSAGILMQYFLRKHYEYAFIANLFLHVVIILYVKYALKETRGRFRTFDDFTARTDEFETSRLAMRSLFSLDHVKSMFNTIFKKRETRASILFLCFCSICSFYAMSVQLTLTFAFVRNRPISWTSSIYSYYSGFSFMAGGLCLLIILPIIYHRKPNTPDKVIAGLGFASKGLGLLNLGFAKTSEQVFVGIALFAFAEYTMPAVRSMLSKAITVDERGKAFSFLGFLSNISSFTGSLLFPSIYTMSLNTFPGLVFEIAAATQFLALLILIFAVRVLWTERVTHRRWLSITTNIERNDILLTV